MKTFTNVMAAVLCFLLLAAGEASADSGYQSITDIRQSTPPR